MDHGEHTYLLFFVFLLFYSVSPRLASSRLASPRSIRDRFDEDDECDTRCEFDEQQRGSQLASLN